MSTATSAPFVIQVGSPPYIVDRGHPAADDNNPGTEALPWATIQHAAATLQPGERVAIKAGNYSPFNPQQSGTAGKRIVYSAYPGHEHAVVIDGTGLTRRGLIEIRAKDYITIEGFRLQNANMDGVYVEGVAGERHGHHIIRDCQVDTTGNSGVYVCGLVMGQTIPSDDYRTIDVLIEECDITNTNTPSGVNEALTVGGGVDGVIARSNVVHDTDQYGIDFKLGVRNGVIAGNRIYNVEKHGIYLDAGCRTLEAIEVYNNRVYGCAGNGICIAREANRGPTEGYEQNIRNVDVFNNVVFRSRRGLLIYQHVEDTLINDFDRVQIVNNTFFDNQEENCRMANLDSVITNFLFANNIAFQSGSTNVVNQFVTSAVATNNIEVDPLFVSTGAVPDLHLGAGSPAIGAGDGQYAPASDYDDVPRGSPPDAGAYEYVP
ncbi:MAG: right-handed parallel beta-helix repeat-containing protein [Deltaproteobacteria bacterium]|jgi:hypothetical protein|nr:right-handed parallel beta-helix repeat-containing protein [Deltaproteobacteria bacterium]MBW2533056.1 right-handed parallel beta-helix repeat-containing protein [Deltaproteobacteria bacterium]